MARIIGEGRLWFLTSALHRRTLSSADEYLTSALHRRTLSSAEPQSLVPLARFPGARVVLAGDHKQLSPLLLDREAALLGLDRSLLERLVQERLEIEEQQAKIREAGAGGSANTSVAREVLGEAEAAGGLGSAAGVGGDSALLALSEEDKYILSLNHVGVVQGLVSHERMIQGC